MRLGSQRKLLLAQAPACSLEPPSGLQAAAVMSHALVPAAMPLNARQPRRQLLPAEAQPLAGTAAASASANEHSALPALCSFARTARAAAEALAVSQPRAASKRARLPSRRACAFVRSLASPAATAGAVPSRRRASACFGPAKHGVRLAGRARGEWFKLNVSSFTYDALGHVLSLTDSRGTTTYTYDHAGNRTSVTDPTGRRITYAYEGGRMVGQTWYDAEDEVTDTLSFSYDADGELLSASNAAGESTSQPDVTRRG
jgi:YD repeat-containing protein